MLPSRPQTNCSAGWTWPCRTRTPNGLINNFWRI
jgi:hypothetical protein